MLNFVKFTPIHYSLFIKDQSRFVPKSGEMVAVKKIRKIWRKVLKKVASRDLVTFLRIDGILGSRLYF